MSGPLPWSHRAAEVPETGLQARRTATPAECAAVAQALDLVSCEAIEADYAIRPIGKGCYALSGTVSARLTQTCVVTLEPVAQTLKEALEVEFWPAGTLPDAGESEVEVHSMRDIEPIEHGMIEVGRVVFEVVSGALDPYPRKPGARFEWEDRAGTGEPPAEGAFAGLKGLKEGR